MVAIATPSPLTHPAPRRRALHVAPEPTAPAPLRLVGLAALVLVVVLAVGYLASTTATPPGATGAAPTLDAHVVAEGETRWSIAQAIAPAGEAGTYVERLVAANGGGAVAVGQVLTVPAP